MTQPNEAAYPKVIPWLGLTISRDWKYTKFRGLRKGVTLNIYRPSVARSLKESIDKDREIRRRHNQGRQAQVVPIEHGPLYRQLRTAIDSAQSAHYSRDGLGREL